jgi:hypothetical protein
VPLACRALCRTVPCQRDCFAQGRLEMLLNKKGKLCSPSLHGWKAQLAIYVQSKLNGLKAP